MDAPGFPFADTQDFDDTEPGFIAKAITRQITAAAGRIVWNLDAYRSSTSRQPTPPIRACGARVGYRSVTACSE